MAIPSAPTTLPEPPTDIRLNSTRGILLAIYAVLLVIANKP